MRSVFTFFLGLLVALPAPAQSELRLNHIQVIGSHNSYKEAIDPALLEMIRTRDPQRATELDYHHVSLTEQLELGLRNLELDVFHDPEGGRFATPYGIQMMQTRGARPASYDPLGTMHEPGFKVLHIQDIDFRSTCLTLQLCLEELKLWSDASPDHLPIFITINAKDDQIALPGFATPLPFNAAALDALDAAIRATLPEDKLLLPDHVRGSHATLPEAIRTEGWPSLDEVRGRFVFILDEGGRKQTAYLAEHPSLQDRTMFVAAPKDSPAAAIFILNDPIGQADQIQRLAQDGFIIRTRADSGTLEARANDITRRDAAFSSGAHLISTDYYLPNPAFETDYQVRLPENLIALCHPLTAPAGCDTSDIEEP